VDSVDKKQNPIHVGWSASSRSGCRALRP